ncbi:MAG: putative toxin-antitoxin system toxin component, PIN family [Actinobacteria bacterium]|nr:putative toxin-antitoxin system toxin component, PIN family [Actinomycetota bacterium]
MRRLVIDANVLASGGIDPQGESPPSLLYRELGGSRFEMVVCPELLGEVDETLRKPYFFNRLGDAIVSDLVTGITEASTVLADPTDSLALLRDPDDDYLVALARECGAEAIVSGDKDLLDHPGVEPPVINPRDACKLLRLLD